MSEDIFMCLFGNNKQKITPLICLFGNKMALIIFNKNKNLEICDYVGNKYIPKMFLEFYENNDLKESIKLLKEKNDLNDYIQSYMMFNNDYASPIFNIKNEEIGYGYIFNSQIKDYSFNIINDKLVAFIRLYFNYAKIRFCGNKYKNTKYFLINPDLMTACKNHYNYFYLENILNQNDMVKQIISNLQKKDSNLYDYLNDNIITKIIKNNFLNINQQFLKQSNFNNNINEEPPIEPLQGSSYFYFKNFELIDLDIYQILFNSDEFAKNGNLRECFFENNYVYFSLPPHFCGNINKSNIEICKLNQDNSFSANFLMECNNKNSFKIIIENAKQNGGFENFINSNQNNNTEQLYDNNGNPIGIIYNLTYNLKYNSNINNINNNYNTINKNISCQNNTHNFNIINNFSYVNNNNNNNINNNFINKTQIPNQKLIFKKIKDEFKIPPLIGLKNVGATCYMNATLQCLSQIEKLSNYFKYHDRVIFVIETLKNQNCLTKSFKFLVENLWPSTTNSDYINPKFVGSNTKNNYFIPEKFKEKISLMNPLFQGVQANDTKDLVNFIIMTLHEELNKKNKYQHKNNYFNVNLNQYDQKIVWNNFVNAFIAENKSIISDLFYGVTHTVTICLGCNTCKHNFESYFFLNFPLEEVRRYKMQILIDQNMMITNQVQNNMNNNWINNNSNQIFQQNLNKIQFLQNNQVNIYDCFEYNQKEEKFIGDNSMYCNKCNMQTPSVYTTYLYSAPLTLILVLNRGKGIQFKVKMGFYLELDLSNFIQAKSNNEIIKYDLIGVVTHMGESGAGGHFIATCKSPIDGQWYQYNDDSVYKINDFNSEILNYAMPYILFYQKRE